VIKKLSCRETLILGQARPLRLIIDECRAVYKEIKHFQKIKGFTFDKVRIRYRNAKSKCVISFKVVSAEVEIPELLKPKLMTLLSMVTKNPSLFSNLQVDINDLELFHIKLSN
jgi:hypothetical protein